MVHRQFTEEDKKRCLFVARYRKVNPTTWCREKPRHYIAVADDEWPEEYATPQVREISGHSHEWLVVEVCVLDREAVDLENTDNFFLGNWEPTAERCDAALKEYDPGTCIIPKDAFSDMSR